MSGSARKASSPGTSESLSSLLSWGLDSLENKVAGPRPDLLVLYPPILLSGIPFLPGPRTGPLRCPVLGLCLLTQGGVEGTESCFLRLCSCVSKALC